MTRILLVFSLLLFDAGDSFAQSVSTVPERHDVTGTYSDMTHVDESGDVVGVEIHLLRASSGFFVVFQDAEGVLRDPYLVRAKVEAGRVEFVLPYRDGYSGKFVGQMRPHGLIGSFMDGQVNSHGETEFILRKIGIISCDNHDSE